MKFSVNSKVLLSRLQAAGKAINKKTPITILENFHLTLNEGVLTIMASDSEHVVVTSLQVWQSEGAGKVCIHANRLIDLIKAMPNCPLYFDVDVNRFSAKLQYANGEYDIVCTDAKDFPYMSVQNLADVVGSFEISAQQILKAYDSVSFAVATEDIRPALQGVYWDIKPDAVIFVSTDTHNLAKFRTTAARPQIETNFIQPLRSLPLVQAFLSKENQIKVTVTKKTVVFEGSDFKVYTQRINGNFPPYDRVIPATMPINIRTDRTALQSAVSRVALCSDYGVPLLRVAVGNGNIMLSVQDANNGISGKEIVTTDYSGEMMTVGFNANGVKGLLNAIASRNVVIRLQSPDRPGLITPAENEEHEELTLLIMPMTIE